MKLAPLVKIILSETASKWIGKSEIPFQVEGWPRMKFKFKVAFPDAFVDQDEFEDFILDNDLNNIFGEIKERIGDEEGWDIEDDSEEQDANEATWQLIYDICDVPYERHY